MSVTTLARLWLVLLLYGGKGSQASGADVPRQLVNANIISLEEYGIVFKPGRLMSTSDVTHIQQGFVIDIPNRKVRNRLLLDCRQFVPPSPSEVSSHHQVLSASMRYSLGYQLWLSLTTKALEKQHYKLIIETLISLPSDDRRWVKPEKGNRRSKRKPKTIEKTATVEEIEDITSYHVFGLGWSSDVKYNRKMIKVINKAIGDNQDDLSEFINRTELVFGQIEEFAESVVKLEWRVRDMNYSMRKTFADVGHAQKANIYIKTYSQWCWNRSWDGSYIYKTC